MKALISSNQKQTEVDINYFKNSMPSIKREELRFFTQTSGLADFPTDGNSIGSIYYNQPISIFEEVYVGDSVRLFQNTWGRAFLRLAMRMVSTNGKLIVSSFSEKQAAINGMWSTSALIEFLGDADAIYESKKNIVVFKKVDMPEVFESTLDWYIHNAANMVIFDILHRANPLVSHYERIDYTTLGLLYDSAERVVGGARKEIAEAPIHPEVGKVPWYGDKNMVPIEQELARAVKSHAYYAGGISYKSAILKHLINEFFSDTESLSIIDFGGGYGLLVAELLMDKDLNVDLGVVRDYSPSNMVFSAMLYRHLRDILRDKFYFSLGKSEEFEFDKKFNLITFVGSLLYVAKDKQANTLRKCWDSLLPGGLLVIHENIKNPSYKADYELMFTVDGIDSALSEFGEIRYFMSTNIKELRQKDVGERSVFRVIQKQR